MSANTMTPRTISREDAEALREMLNDQWNSIETYRVRHKDALPLAVAEGLSRELTRLRKLSEALRGPEQE